MRTNFRRLELIIAAAMMAAWSGSAARVQASSPASLGVRGRVNANVSVAASGRFVAVVWSATDTAGAEDIEAATSRDAGATFSPAVRVNQAAGSARVGGEQPPRVSLVARRTGDPAIAVVWTATGAKGTRLVSARSDDGGRTFTGEAVVPGSDAPGNRGWESVATDPLGHFDVLWLDHRDAAEAGAGDMAHHMDHASSASMQMDSVAKAQLSKLYFASVGTSTPGRAVAAGVCYCCKTGLAVGPDGAIYAVWREVYPGNIRDIAFTMSTDGGRTFSAPERVSEDKWAIDGCPENGPSLAVDRAHTVHVVWPTIVAGPAGSAGDLGLFYAESKGGGKFSARQTVPSVGTPRHVQIVEAPDAKLLIAWDEADAHGRRIAFAAGTPGPNGRVAFARQVISALGDASFPAIAETPQGILVAAAGGGDADTSIRVVRLAVK
jgi:hypothetical protein